MRPTKFTEVKVGAFVLIILVLFAVGIFAIGSHQKYFQRQYTLWACFSNISGLMVGAPVRLAGLTVGRVSAIYFGEIQEEKSMHVYMKINKEVQERIREDSVATIQTMGLLGDKYVEITLGSPDKKVLAHQACMQSVDPIDLFAYVTKTELVIDAINTILMDIKEISTEIKSGEGLLHSILYDPAGGEAVRNLSVASASLDDVIQDISDVSRSLQNVIDDAGGDLVKNLMVASAAMGELIKDVSPVVRSAGNIVEKVERGEGSLGAVINDPTVYEDLRAMLKGADVGELVKELCAVVRSVGNIVEKVERGEGSLGAVINDPTVYEDLKVILGGAKRSKVIKELVRYTIKKKKEDEIGEGRR